LLVLLRDFFAFALAQARVDSRCALIEIATVSLNFTHQASSQVNRLRSV